jgi:hypothetical protein
MSKVMLLRHVQVLRHAVVLLRHVLDALLLLLRRLVWWPP